MIYLSACSKTSCLLLSTLLVTTAASGGDTLSHHIQHTSSNTNNNNNDYMESILRRLDETSGGNTVTDRLPKKHTSCAIGGIEDCASTYYYYKDFDGGVTFAGAHSAIATEADLEHCVLAPIYSYDDLVEISAAIPPCAAAYTAAYKDPLRVFREARACVLNGMVPYNCDFEPLGETLKSLWGGAETGSFGVCSLEDWFGDFMGGETWCPALKSDGWVNFGSTTPVPSESWRKGDSSYCGEGPIQNAAAAFATDYSSVSPEENREPTVFLKALNSGEYLPGAVYKCCHQEEMATCFND